SESPWAHVPKGEVQFSFQWSTQTVCAVYRVISSSTVTRLENGVQNPAAGGYSVTVTVMLVHKPSTARCRSSPSCSVSLCVPGGNCISISEFPVPKCTQGAAF